MQQLVIDAVQVLSTNPRTQLLDIKKLVGAQTLDRVRLGDYRLVYDVQHDVLTIIVIRIGHRRDIYRKL